MIKKLISLLIALLAIVPAHAQLATGSWRSFPIFNDVITKIVDTPDKVYYLASGVLYCYDKKGDETYCLSDGNLLTDVDVRNIYYNPDKDYLAVVYQNANIDLVYDRAHIVNLSEIKNAVTNDDKVINDVSFGDNTMYVSANFGLVIYDDTLHEVKQSGFYDRGVLGAVEVDGYLLIAYNDGPQIFSIPLGNRINSINNFKRVLGIGWNIKEMRTLDAAAHRVVARADKGLFFYTAEPYIADERKELTQYAGCSSLISAADGIYFVHNNTFYKIDSDGSINVVSAIPDPLKNNVYATWDGPAKSLWAGDANGIGNYKIADGTLTVLSDKTTPDNYITVNKVAMIVPSWDKSGLFISNIGVSMYSPAADNSLATSTGLYADYYENGEVKSIAPTEDVTTKYASTPGWLQNNVKRNTIISPSFILNDPDDSELIYIGSGFEGLYVIKNGKEIAHIYKDNAPLDEPWGCRVTGGNIDKFGNLWLQNYTNGRNGFIVLPSDKRRDIVNVKKEDWIACDFDGAGGGFDGKILSCVHSNITLLNAAGFRSPLIVLDSSRDIKDSHVFNMINTFTDQDGNSFMPIYMQCMVEDHDGRVWIGTGDNGVLEITRPADAMNPNFIINRIKVPRNDGSNLADYLMGSEDVQGISVDASNRKWIATKNSGIYLVSERGDEILEHFDTSNSPLPTNTINCIYADTNSNSVFIGTNYGLMEYSADSSPARPDYSEVYAYPNPVTPEYTGWITIKGLMDNSLVKICDAGMNVIAQIQSEGGMALWDGCNHAGERVKSGVYYVLASQSDGSSSTGAVATKILVVN